MSSWKTSFNAGITYFRAGKHQEALDSFSEAIKLGGDNVNVYDSRAAVYQKLGKLKNALADAKSVIDLQPERWQGYARSARLFFQGRKYDAASRMTELALERIPPDQARRREEMIALQSEITAAQEAAAKLASHRAYHFGKLPVEIAMTMFSMILEEDHAYVVILAQVCKNWRAAILDTPRFWQTLVLGSHHPRRKLRVWCERAGGRIRELALLETLVDQLPVLQALQSLPLGSLCTLRLVGHVYREVMSYLPNLTTQTFASLHTLVVQPADREEATLCPPDTPALDWRVLKLSRMHLDDFDVVANRLTRLESLSMSDCFCYHNNNWENLLFILHQNPRLAQLELKAFYPSNSPDEPPRDLPPSITAPNLAEVSIQNEDSLANAFLPRISAPSLRSLVIIMHMQPLKECFDWLAAGAATRLTTLSIQSSAVNAQALLDMLPSAPALESLQLTHLYKVAHRVLEALATPLGSTTLYSKTSQADVRRVLCPALRHLDVSSCPDVVARPIIALVKLRHPETQASAPPPPVDGDEDGKPALPPVRQLESLVIDGCPDVDAEVLPWLRAAVPSVSCVYMSKKNARWTR